MLSKRDVEALPFPICWCVIGRPTSVASKTRLQNLLEVLFGGLRQKARQKLENLHKPKIQEDGFGVFSNFEIPLALQQELRSVAKLVLEGSASDVWNRTKLAELIQHQRTCRRLFRTMVVKRRADGPLLVRGVSLLNDDDGD